MPETGQVSGVGVSPPGFDGGGWVYVVGLGWVRVPPWVPGARQAYDIGSVSGVGVSPPGYGPHAGVGGSPPGMGHDAGGWVFGPGGPVRVPPWTPTMQEVRLDERNAAELRAIHEQIRKLEDDAKAIVARAVPHGPTEPHAKPDIRRAGAGWILTDPARGTCYYVHD